MLIVIKWTVRTPTTRSDVPIPTTEHRHHIRWEPNNLSYWSLIEKLERAWLEFLEQHEPAVKFPQSKVSSQPENFTGQSNVIGALIARNSMRVTTNP